MNRALMLLAVLLLFAAWTQPLSGFGELPEPLEATDPTDPPEFSYEEFKKALPELFEKWKNLIQIHPHNSRELGSEFNCSTKKPPGVHKPPKSVHELTPFDVQVVAALGDSLTAANGAKGIKPLDCLTQYRGVSWSIGGDKNLTQVVTLPNILRNYNKDLRGFSLYEAEADDISLAHLNVAIPGSIAQDMPSQARELIQRLKSGIHGADWENDWKVITLFVGGNNLCKACLLPRADTNSLTNFISNVTESLDTLHREIPRAFVNLVPAPDVSEQRFLNKGVVCSVLHLYECPCGAYGRKKKVKELQDLVHSYNDALKELATSGRYDTRDDFTVVYQPFVQNMTAPLVVIDGKIKYDMEFFAPDCFHFSDKGHSHAAKSLWNNMLSADEDKDTMIDMVTGIHCPDPRRPFFPTHRSGDGKTRVRRDAAAAQRQQVAPPRRDHATDVDRQTTLWLHTSLAYIMSRRSDPAEGSRVYLKRFVANGLLEDGEIDSIMACMARESLTDCVQGLHLQAAPPLLQQTLEAWTGGAAKQSQRSNVVLGFSLGALIMCFGVIFVAMWMRRGGRQVEPAAEAAETEGLLIHPRGVKYV